MNEEFSGTLELDSPITDEQFDAITDVDFNYTNRIWFHTKNGKDVEFVKAPSWIPVTERYPEVDAEGHSSDILLSFDNFSGLCIGQFRMDEKGGAFYDGVDETPLVKIGLIVNAWMSLPDPYREDAT